MAFKFWKERLCVMKSSCLWAILMMLAGDALRRAISVIAGNHVDSDARTEGIAALAGLITFAVTFVTLFTVSDARIAAMFAFLLAVIWHRSQQSTPVTPRA